MKIKLTSISGKYTAEFYGVEIGSVYEVVRQHELGGVSIKTPYGRRLPLFTSEYEVVNED